MSEKLHAVKGMNDILPPDSAKWAFVERRARAAFENHGYREVRPPVVEKTELFVRSIGEATDVVAKEMYTFMDRGDKHSLTLRPEGTAGAARAYLEHSLAAKEAVTRWYYSGPMFRAEQPQVGRYRQFYQMGVEAYGVAEPSLDAEQIAMLLGLFQDIGIPDLEVAINSVGGPEDRPRYREALVAYFTPFQAELCEDCKRRLEVNPLRLLDCKNPDDQKRAAGAPSILESLSDASKAHFEGVKKALDAMRVAYQVEPRMVRGLDYYTATVYEVRTRGGHLGAQNTLGGGGRYDKMIEEMGGPITPAVGFAFGMERVILSLPGAADSFDAGHDVFFVCLGDAARSFCLEQAHELRSRGFRVELEHRAISMKAQMKRADKLKARVTLIVGDGELANGTVMLRDMKASEQRAVPQAELASELKRLLR